MKLHFLIGIWLGFFLSFLIAGWFEGEFNWAFLIASLIGGTLAHFLLIVPLSRKYPHKESK
ncbi:hypothetical protein ACFFJI_10195 [Allobacillus sp. GCM10007491]|uniref:Uncharacterized protein n=2 Tax=Allobacillus TaxID=1400133 RepID=A0A941HSE0_9BACI|nr:MULTISPECIES: hypothetical protein [Allobacillus]MBR7552595.1 hypothetical protein [Allobacillus saliphilus]TSJ62560.1 hypothetical protein FPQ13_09590 [Allobacillus salarius]